jgi:hypothetical protein
MTHSDHPHAQLIREGLATFQQGDTAWLDDHLAHAVTWTSSANVKSAGATGAWCFSVRFGSRRVDERTEAERRTSPCSSRP